MQRVIQTGHHRRLSVDPFGILPCTCDQILVHITDSEGMADDLAECPVCRVVVRLGELYRGMFPERIAPRPAGQRK